MEKHYKDVGWGHRATPRPGAEKRDEERPTGQHTKEGRREKESGQARHRAVQENNKDERR